MDDVLSTALREATYEWFERLETVARDADAESQAALAQTELVRLTEAWRALLAEHEPDEDGRCPQCSGWRRPKSFPCPVWLCAHRRLVACDGGGHHAAPNWADAW